jgi:outer membrane protein OmpA-like peptidoglycan-associated protein
MCDQAITTVAGFTDASGPTTYNLDLSARRARVVRDALISDGDTPESFQIEAHGETDPARATADGVRDPLNRRVIITTRWR